MPIAARSVEELFPLIEFCKNGDLKAVSDWIAKGNPLDLPTGKKTRRASPLQIAIEKGFLTLTETLLDAGANPSTNGNALWIGRRLALGGGHRHEKIGGTKIHRKASDPNRSTRQPCGHDRCGAGQPSLRSEF